MGSFNNVAGSIQFDTERGSLNMIYHTTPKINFGGETPSIN
jgi:hypothetical protein